MPVTAERDHLLFTLGVDGRLESAYKLLAYIAWVYSEFGCRMSALYQTKWGKY